MIINTKFNIDDTVYFMRDNKVISDIVNTIYFSLYRDGSGGIKYKLKASYKGNWPEYSENQIFASKQELLDSL